MKILYLSYDGMTDPLGQSQVLPYLIGLSDKGVNISLVSFEKEEKFRKHKQAIQKIVDANEIEWLPQRYTKKPPVFSTIKDIGRFYNVVDKLVLRGDVDLIHCRSYVSALVGLRMRKKYEIPFLFDMRGFWADERVDGGIWSLSNPLSKRIYRYFKKKEKVFLTRSSATISLTECGKDEINSWGLKNTSPIEVIPCCTDEKLFSLKNVDEKFVELFKKNHGISQDDFVVSYLGSIGTWYLLDEMLDFFKVLTEKKSNAKILFITQEPEALIIESAEKKDIDRNRIIIQSAKRNEVPSMLSISNISLFFIKKAYSKKASSPTKMGEIMNLGIPVICNNGVGDTDLIMNEVAPSLLVKEFTSESYESVINEIEKSEYQTEEFKKQLKFTANKYFSLEKGIEKFFNIYQNILKNK